MQEQQRTVARRRPPTPEEQERFRNAYEEEVAADPEILAEAERVWSESCRVPLAHLRSAGVLDVRAIVAELKTKREAAGMTLDAVAAASGIGTQTLVAVESGEIAASSPRTLQKYAAALGLRLVTELLPVE